MSRRRLRAVLDFIAPELCAHCREPIVGDGAFCNTCLVKWQAEKSRAELEHHGIPAVYLKTGSKAPIEKNVICLAYYDPSDNESAASSLVYKLKENATERILDFIALEYSALLERAAPELFNGTINGGDILVTWIPRRPEAVRVIGYDHMECCARVLANSCGFKCRQLILRSKDALEQKLLNTKGRFENAERTMSFSGVKISGKTIVLIDDLVTSGASMLAAETILLENGARAVISAALLATHHRSKTLD